MSGDHDEYMDIELPARDPITRACDPLGSDAIKAGDARTPGLDGQRMAGISPPDSSAGTLLAALKIARPFVAAASEASHFMDGFRLVDGVPCANRSEQSEDGALQIVDAAISLAETPQAVPAGATKPEAHQAASAPERSSSGTGGGVLAGRRATIEETTKKEEGTTRMDTTGSSTDSRTAPTNQKD